MNRHLAAYAGTLIVIVCLDLLWLVLRFYKSFM